MFAPRRILADLPFKRQELIETAKKKRSNQRLLTARQGRLYPLLSTTQTMPAAHALWSVYLNGCTRKMTVSMGGEREGRKSLMHFCSMTWTTRMVKRS